MSGYIKNSVVMAKVVRNEKTASRINVKIHYIFRQIFVSEIIKTEEFEFYSLYFSHTTDLFSFIQYLKHQP